MSTNTHVPITDPVAKRVAMINGYFDLPDDTIQSMKRVREASVEYAKELQCIFKYAGVNVDTGRAIAAIDHVQQTKNIACDALILPFASEKRSVPE